MKTVRTLFRILVGLVFIFSGFVKGIDPLGTAFRMEDYFLAFGTTWAIPASLPLSIILCVAEFVLGVCLLFNLALRRMAWVLILMMTYFTILTFFDATYNLVPDCGCFGEAVKLSNVATFIKNLILMVFIVPIFIWRSKYKSAIGIRGDIVVITLFTIAFGGLSVWSVRHLPLIDFMDWKTGNRINQKETQPVKFFVTYKSKLTGEEKEYLSPNYPWNDSTWLAEWEFAGQRVEDPNALAGAVLKVEDLQGNDVTRSILDYPDYHFIFTSWNLEKARDNAFNEILPFYVQARDAGIPFICITSALPEEIRAFRLKHGTAFEYYNADDIVIKTMVRSNPGLILLKDGVVIAKYNSRDIPPFSEIRKKFLQGN